MYIIQKVLGGGTSVTIAQLSDGFTPANVDVDFGELGFPTKSLAIQAAKGFRQADPMDGPANNYYVLDETGTVVWSHPKNI